MLYSRVYIIILSIAVKVNDFRLDLGVKTVVFLQQPLGSGRLDSGTVEHQGGGGKCSVGGYLGRLATILRGFSGACVAVSPVKSIPRPPKNFRGRYQNFRYL